MEEEDHLNELQQQISRLSIAQDPEDQQAMDLIRNFANQLRHEEGIIL